MDFQQAQVQAQQQQRKLPANMPPNQQISPQEQQRIAVMLRNHQQIHQVNPLHQFHPMMQQAPHAILGSSQSGKQIIFHLNFEQEKVDFLLILILSNS